MTELPAHLVNRQSRGLAQRVSQNLGTSSPPYLSILGGKFTLVDAASNEQNIPTYEMDPNKVMRGQAPGPYADVTIIDVNDHISRIFYDVPFDPGAQSYQPPACFSHNGQAPSKLASSPQSPTCAACPNAVWGSATSNVSGKGIPACAQYQLIAVLVAGHDLPFLLRIPPNSLKNYRAYAEQFRGQAFDMDGVVTRLSFISQGTLAFIPAAFAQPAALALGDKLVSAKATDAMVGRLDVPIQGLLPPPTPAAAASPVTAQPVAFQSTQTAPQPQQPQGQQPSATPVGASPSNGRRRRNTAAAPATAPAQPQQMQAPFMEQPPQNQPVQPPNPTFGMQTPPPPNADVSSMLDNLFGPAK
jgi:hypothetical protein